MQNNFNVHSTLFVIRLLMLMTVAIFGLLVIAKKYIKSNGGYTNCFHCRRRISILRKLYSGSAFCSKVCRENDDAQFRRDAVTRLWNEASRYER